MEYSIVYANLIDRLISIFILIYQLAGIVVGTIIGTLVFVVCIFIIGCGVNKFRKHKKRKRTYIHLENTNRGTFSDSF